VKDQKAKTKRQLVEDARRASLESRWAETIELNQQIVERFPRDAEAYNRIGRALMEHQRYADATDAYTAALRIDPANMIARRNLQRLDLLRRRTEAERGELAPAPATIIPRPTVFIEEVGKTWVDELVNPVALEQLVEVPSGQRLNLEADDRRLYVVDGEGRRLGEIEAKTAERVIELMSGGNRYEVYALGISAHSLRIILREVYREPSLGTRVSFPRHIKNTRAYMRERDILRQRDEADFLLSDEDDDTGDDDDARVEAGEDLEPAESDADPFIEETVTVEEEEPQI